MSNTDFLINVYDVVRLIPEGRVTSYGAIAKYLGSKQSSRMVGWAMNASHKKKDIPDHRVVNRNGMLTGKYQFESPSQMKCLLEKEGLEIQQDQIVDFNLFFWDPSIELDIS